jgi:hypothetical protein
MNPNKPPEAVLRTGMAWICATGNMLPRRNKPGTEKYPPAEGQHDNSGLLPGNFPPQTGVRRCKLIVSVGSSG